MTDGSANIRRLSTIGYKIVQLSRSGLKQCQHSEILGVFPRYDNGLAGRISKCSKHVVNQLGAEVHTKYCCYMLGLRQLRTGAEYIFPTETDRSIMGVPDCFRPGLHNMNDIYILPRTLFRPDSCIHWVLALTLITSSCLYSLAAFIHSPHITYNVQSNDFYTLYCQLIDKIQIIFRPVFHFWFSGE